MSKVQDTLRKVVALGWYGSGEERAEFMCHALEHARSAGVITEDEHENASEAINLYIYRLSPSSCVMAWALHNAGFNADLGPRHWAPEAGRKFYSEWDNRPTVAP